MGLAARANLLNNRRSLQGTLPLSRLIAAPTAVRMERQLFCEDEGSVRLLILVGVAISHDTKTMTFRTSSAS
jgi:hypothetical protein